MFFWEKEFFTKAWPYIKEGFFFLVYYCILAVFWIGKAVKKGVIVAKQGAVTARIFTHLRSKVRFSKSYKKINLFEFKLQLAQNYTVLEKSFVDGQKTVFEKLLSSIAIAASVFGKVTRAIALALSTIGSFFSKVGKKIVSYRVGYFVLGALCCAVLLIAWQSYIFVTALPSPKNIGRLNYPTSTHIYDRNGEMLYEIYKEQNRTPVSLKSLPKYVAQATIAIEDKDFYNHSGVSLIGGILRAAKDSYLTHELQGGSTITQQLVKTALLSSERTVERKIKEIILAVWTEQLYTKDRILEMYLNQVAYGGAAYGIEEAAKAYFGKSAQQLTLDEAALLAGLPRAPSVYSPHVDPARAERRRNDVLKRMLQERFITQEQFEAALAKPIAVQPPKTDINAPHFVFYIKKELEDEYGAPIVEEGGLRVKTSLDLTIQREAEKILQEELEKVSYLNIQNGAILITKPQTGEIVAMVGSKNYFDQPYGAFNVTTGLRQPGSTIKPVMYSLALANGFTAATIIQDQPLVISIPGSEPYRPVNYDGQYHGAVPIRLALANSYNIPAVKVLQSVGVDRFIDHAQKMGIDTWQQDRSRYGLSITLGGGEVTMIDMAEAFGVFANGGKHIDASGVVEIEDLYGDILDSQRPAAQQVLDSGISYIMSDILSDNAARQRAFGPGSALEIPGYRAAVKTGTTNELKDNWTIGYTPDYVVTVWVGNNDNTPMNPYLVSGITGAAPIWNRMMTYLLQKDYPGKANTWMEKPTNVVDRLCYGKVEYFVAGTENSVYCQPTPQPGQQWQNGQWQDRRGWR